MPPHLTPLEAMAMIGGYRSRKAFMASMRRAGVRRVAVNLRVIRYDRISFLAWVARRTE